MTEHRQNFQINTKWHVFNVFANTLSPKKYCAIKTTSCVGTNDPLDTFTSAIIESYFLLIKKVDI